MSDLVKSNGVSGMSKRGSGRKKTVNVDPPKDPQVTVETEGGPEDAAILLADAQHMRSIDAFNRRTDENFQRLLNHVSASGRRQYQAVAAAVKDTYGLTERDIYSEGAIEPEYDDCNETALPGE